MINIVSFKLNKLPSPNLKDGFLIARGIAPSMIPCGQIYLQNMGGTTSYLSPSTRVIASISPNSITYFMYLKGFSFFVLNFLEGIFANRSWKNPKGQRKPQISLANTTPKNIIVPIT